MGNKPTKRLRPDEASGPKPEQPAAKRPRSDKRQHATTEESTRFTDLMGPIETETPNTSRTDKFTYPLRAVVYELVVDDSNTWRNVLIVDGANHVIETSVRSSMLKGMHEGGFRRKRTRRQARSCPRSSSTKREMTRRFSASKITCFYCESLWCFACVARRSSRTPCLPSCK